MVGEKRRVEEEMAGGSELTVRLTPSSVMLVATIILPSSFRFVFVGLAETKPKV